MYIVIERTEYVAESGAVYDDLDTYFRKEVTPKISSQIYDFWLNELHFGTEADANEGDTASALSDSLFFNVFNNAFIVYNECDQPEMKELCDEFHSYLPTAAGIYYYIEDRNVWQSAEDVLDLSNKIRKVKGMD